MRSSIDLLIYFGQNIVQLDLEQSSKEMELFVGYQEYAFGIESNRQLHPSGLKTFQINRGVSPKSYYQYPQADDHITLLNPTLL